MRRAPPGRATTASGKCPVNWPPGTSATSIVMFRGVGCRAGGGVSVCGADVPVAWCRPVPGLSVCTGVVFLPGPVTCYTADTRTGPGGGKERGARGGRETSGNPGGCGEGCPRGLPPPGAESAAGRPLGGGWPGGFGRRALRRHDHLRPAGAGLPGLALAPAAGAAVAGARGWRVSAVCAAAWACCLLPGASCWSRTGCRR
jgi:hypothetical protein